MGCGKSQSFKAVHEFKKHQLKGLDKSTEDLQEVSFTLRSISDPYFLYFVPSMKPIVSAATLQIGKIPSGKANQLAESAWQPCSKGMAHGICMGNAWAMHGRSYISS